MSDIAIELIIILLLATLIGWFLGRFLTKNKEVEERAINRQLNQTIEAITKERDNTQQLLNQAKTQSQESSKLAAELEHALNNADVRHQSLLDERKALLTKLQDLEVNHSRLELIAEEYHSQTQSFLALKADHAEQAIQLTKQNTNLTRMQQHLDDSLEQAKQHIEALNDARADISKHQGYILELEKDQKALKLLRLDYSEALSNISMLKEDKTSLHQRHTELRTEHQDLRLQCSALRDDSLKFNDRIKALIDEKELLIQTVEQLTIEKNDYLGRLRAISGVIDVVGTEKISSSTSNQEYIPRNPVIIK